MKKNNRMLLILGAALLVLITAALLVVRQDLQQMLASHMSKEKYANVPVAPFKHVSFTSPWTANIRQGKSHQVEISLDSNTATHQIESRADTLWLTGDSLVRAKVRIMMPVLHSLSAKGSSNVRLSNFTTDSLYLKLGHLDTLLGNGSKFEWLDMQTDGKVTVGWIMPME